MKKLIYSLILVITILYPCSVSFSDDRYEYVCKDVNESLFYIDKSSITRTDVPNVFRCWYRDVVSDKERQRYIYFRNDIKMQKLSYVMYCFEINLAQNIYKGIEERTYDRYGNIIDRKIATKSVWETIPQNSVMSAMSKIINQITNYDSAYRLIPSSIIFTALIAGITISVLIVCLYSKLTSQKHTKANNYQSTAEEYQENIFTDENTNDDFEYPYEDIGEATRM